MYIKNDFAAFVFRLILALCALGQLGFSWTGCPSNAPQVYCYAAPCSVASCPRFPGARCEDYYCGGCMARYYINGHQEVTSICQQSAGRRRRDTGECPTGVTRVYCYVPPCQTTSCPNHPSAICQNNYCGGCNAWFFEGSTNVTSTC